MDTMKVQNLFNRLGVGQSFSGVQVFLDHNSGKVTKVERKPDSVFLTLKDSSGNEGHAFMRVQDRIKNLENRERLLKWASEAELIGLNLNEIEGLSVEIELENTPT